VTRGFNLDPGPLRRIATLVSLGLVLAFALGIGAGAWLGATALTSHPTPQTIYVYATLPPSLDSTVAPTTSPSPSPSPTPTAAPTASPSE
jgi:hypothetical protein